jgi:hypothetical protein
MATTPGHVSHGDHTETQEPNRSTPHEDEEATDTRTPLVMPPATVREVGTGRSRLTYEPE